MEEVREVEMMITYIVSVFSSVLITKVLINKYLIQTEKMFDENLKQMNEIADDYLHKVLIKVDKHE